MLPDTLFLDSLYKLYAYFYVQNHQLYLVKGEFLRENDCEHFVCLIELLVFFRYTLNTVQM